MCQLSSTRQFLRSTVVPCLAAAAFREAPLRRQRVQTFFRQRTDRDDADPVLAGQRHAGRADLRGDGKGHVILIRQQLQRGVVQLEPVGLHADPLALEQPADHADRLILAVAQQHRIDAQRMRIRRQRAGTGAEDHPPTGHPVELHDALRDVERVVIGQGHDAGRQLDALRPFPGRGQEHLGRGDHLPAAGMMFAAPEFVIAEPVQMLDEIDVAAELQQRVSRRSGDAARGRHRNSDAAWAQLQEGKPGRG